MRLGFFGPGLTSPATIVPYQAFVAQLRELGFNEGQNIVIEYRNLDDPRGPFVAAADLMRSQPDLIVAVGPEVALQAVVGASRAVPIVMIAINYDPIARGYVTSLARPGGNITGVVSQQLELAQKQVELLTQAFPDRTRLAILFDALSADQFTAAERAAKLFNMQPQALKLENPPYDFGCPIRQRSGGRGANGARPVQPLVHSAPPPNCRAGGSASNADHVHQQKLRRRGRAHVLWRQFPAHVPRAALTTWRKFSKALGPRTSRSSRPKIRAGRQPQDRQGARHRAADVAAAARRRGDRIEAAHSVLHLLTAGSGTKLPCQPRRAMSAIGGRSADICSMRVLRILTHNGPRPR